jgi:hypothetical protein
MAANSSGASVFAKHPTISGLYVGQTDSTSTIGIDPIVFCIFRGLASTDVLDTTASTYHHGCLAIVVDDSSGTASVYQNTGSYTAPSWTLFDTGTSFSLPATVTDTTTTTGTSFGITANSVTSGGVESLTATGATTGYIFKVVGAAATLSTGFYIVANDGALNVFTVGANGHLTSNQTTAPTVASTVAQGITAAAITAGGTDTCGIITTTGTQNNTADSTITVTFNKTYTTAPKVVQLTAANAAGASGQAYISSITATTFVVGFAKSATWAATPSYNYLVVA